MARSLRSARQRLFCELHRRRFWLLSLPLLLRCACQALPTPAVASAAAVPAPIRLRVVRRRRRRHLRHASLIQGSAYLNHAQFLPGRWAGVTAHRAHRPRLRGDVAKTGGDSRAAPDSGRGGRGQVGQVGHVCLLTPGFAAERHRPIRPCRGWFGGLSLVSARFGRLPRRPGTLCSKSAERRSSEMTLLCCRNPASSAPAAAAPVLHPGLHPAHQTSLPCLQVLHARRLMQNAALQVTRSGFSEQADGGWLRMPARLTSRHADETEGKNDPLPLLLSPSPYPLPSSP